MKQENIVSSRPQASNYVKATMVAMGIAAFSASAFVAWPALSHIGAKLI
ncbi:hypothetical protein [Desulfuromonas sp.]|nr:hypothetical protein [Desulfuromonas sp.]